MTARKKLKRKLNKEQLHEQPKYEWSSNGH